MEKRKNLFSPKAKKKQTLLNKEQSNDKVYMFTQNLDIS